MKIKNGIVESSRARKIILLYSSAVKCRQLLQHFWLAGIARLGEGVSSLFVFVVFNIFPATPCVVCEMKQIKRKPYKTSD